MGCCWALHAACACRAQASLISSVTASPRRRLIRSNVDLRPASLGPLPPPPLISALRFKFTDPPDPRTRAADFENADTNVCADNEAVAVRLGAC